MAQVILMLSLLYTFVKCYNSCLEVLGNNTCRKPGLMLKGCLCDCIHIDVHREFINMNISSCLGVLNNCVYYRIWFEIRFQDFNTGEYILQKDVNFTPIKKDIHIFPIYELTNYQTKNEGSYSPEKYIKLRPDKRYIVLIKPKCTICEESCLFQRFEIPDDVYYVPTTTSSPNPNNKRPTVAFSIFTVLGVLALSVVFGIICFLRQSKMCPPCRKWTPLLEKKKRFNIIPLDAKDEKLTTELLDRLQNSSTI